MPLKPLTSTLARLLAPVALAIALTSLVLPAAARADSGSISDIRATGASYGGPLQATFSATKDSCQPGSYCGWFPVATRSTGDSPCTATYSPIWVGANRSGPDTITETKSFYPERVGTNRFCVFIYYGGTYQKVADVVFNYQPSAPPGSPPGGSSATLRTDPIWSQIGLFPGTDWYYVNDKVGPSYINSWRFVELAKATGTRWALSYLGTTNQAPLRDGDNVVGFSYDVRPGVLGVEIEYLRNKYRRKRLCRKHRHRSGRSHRHCRRGKRRKVGTVLTGEKDVTINATTPWSQAPGRPASHLYDLETVLIHELGHFAGNGSHVHGCVNSPLIDVFDTGEWWRGTNDWGRYGCSNATYRRKPAPGTQQGRMIRITVPPGERGPDPGSGIQSRLSP